jgi:hypothetical protein
MNAPDKKEGCLLCGADLLYLSKNEYMQCALCHQNKEGNAHCKNGHFVCDECHQLGALDAIESYCLGSRSNNPIQMAQELMGFSSIHMHGPEHHFLVPAVLISAWYNAQRLDIDLSKKLKVARKRAEKVPGGACGFHGNCGAATGAGIFLSVVLDSTPLSTRSWSLANRLSGLCLIEVADLGGPRCCKRDTYAVLQKTIDFCKNELNISMDSSPIECTFHAHNQQCLHEECPYFPVLYSLPGTI